MNSKKGKIIPISIVSPYGYSLFNKNCKVPFGGGEVQLYLLAEELAKKKDFRVEFITGNYNLKIKKVEFFKKIKIHISQPLDKKIINYLKRPMSLFLTLIKIKPEIVIQRIAGIDTGICSLYCKFFKKKFIYSIAHKMEVIKGGIRGLKGKLYNYGLKNTFFIVAQSKNQIIALEKWKKKKFNNIKVIKSGYKIQNFNENINFKKYILWVGRAVKWKRPEYFLKLVKLFPNELFIMICPKSYNYYYWRKIKSQAKSLSNLKFFDFIPFYKIDIFFKNAKIFTNTSIYEGFPNTFIQALKNKTPVISLNVDPDNFLTLNKCGFNCNGDFIKMEEYLRKLLTNHDSYKSYSENSFLYAKANHDIEKIGKNWRKLILNLINS